MDPGEGAEVNGINVLGLSTRWGEFTPFITVSPQQHGHTFCVWFVIMVEQAFAFGPVFLQQIKLIRNELGINKNNVHYVVLHATESYIIIIVKLINHRINIHFIKFNLASFKVI